MFDGAVRKLKDVLLEPCARVLGRVFPPLAITLIAFTIALGATYALWHAFYGVALTLWLLSRVLDGLDGTVARLYHKTSALGGYLDLMCDSIIYALFPIAASASGVHPSISIALIALLAVYYVNVFSWAVLAAILEKCAYKNNTATTIVMPRGIIEGLETIVLYSLFCIIPQFMWQLFMITAILVAMSASVHIVWAIKNRNMLGDV